MTAVRSPLIPDLGSDPEPDALIKEARRRQRRRYLAIALATATLIGGIGGVIAASSRGHRHPPGGQRGPSTPQAVRVSPQEHAPILAPALKAAWTNVLTWPVGFPAFGPYGGPKAYVDHLNAGHLSLHRFPWIAGGDYNPYVIAVGRKLVYVGSGGTMTISADLKGKPRVVGATTPFFAPSAVPGYVWLEFDGESGPLIRLPSDAIKLVEGTDAGLLIEVLRGSNDAVALWSPGAASRDLP